LHKRNSIVPLKGQALFIGEIIAKLEKIGYGVTENLLEKTMDQKSSLT
jgi:hypothetical protein